MNNWQLLVAAGFPTATGLVAIVLAMIQMEGLTAVSTGWKEK